jgi:hypothetical protein
MPCEFSSILALHFSKAKAEEIEKCYPILTFERNRDYIEFLVLRNHKELANIQRVAIEVDFFLYKWGTSNGRVPLYHPMTTWHRMKSIYSNNFS